jgi:mannose-6-phosphate isomerase-like protein (cupin superfamily)
MKKIAIVLLLIVFGCNSTQDEVYMNRSAEKILQSFAEDFREDPFAREPITFGVRVRGEGGGDWLIVVEGKSKGDEKAAVRLKKGFPGEPIGYYNMDIETLRKIDRNELSVLTGMGKARSSDIAPVEFDVGEGFEPDPGYWERLMPFTFHFWTRGTPEIIKFAGEYSRVIHGANVVLFYYERGLRTGWYQIEKDQHINEDPKDQTNPFPTMLIITRGKAFAKIGGVEKIIQKGELLFIPAGISHEFWNTNEEPCEGIIIMFGKEA